MSYLNDIEFVSNYIDFDIDFSDELKTKYLFNYLVDNLADNYLISEKTRQNIYLSIDKKKHKAHIVCGSYKLRI